MSATSTNNSFPPSRFRKYWLPVLIYAIFIFLASSIPGNYIPKLFTLQNTIFHILEYAIFALLISRALKGYNPAISFVKRFSLVLLIAIVYAITDEFHQKFIPNRECSLFDVACDGLGTFVLSIFYR
jgi:VanZ family protein